MWCLTLLLLVGAVVAHPGHEHAWETGKQYQYLVRSRTLSTLDKLNDQVSGISIRATLNIQPVTSDRLQATITLPEFARIHTQLPEGLDIQMSDQQLQYQKLPLTGEPFEIVVKHGMIRDLLVHKDVPTWELNLLKGIVSQLQVDTQGENVIYDRSTQVPKEGQFVASFKAMEDTVGGKCEVLYDISPLPLNDLYNTPELAPMIYDKHNENLVQLIDVRKTKNYDNCKQQRGYHFGVRMSLTQGSHRNNDRMITKSSNSRIVLSGDLKRFTIQSAVTTSNIFVKFEQPTDSFLGYVDSKMNLTLVNIVNKVSNENLLNRDNLVSTGNLLYTYNNPLTEIGQGRQHQQTLSRNSQQIESSESSSENQSQGRYLLNQKVRNHPGSSSSSATSSSEEFQHVQTLPSLNEAPKSMTPLSLAFQDDQQKLNLLQEAVIHINQIVQELQQSNSIVEQETLQKFASLVNLLRLMNENQITELEQSILKGNEQLDENDNVLQDTWSVLRDSVEQTGTGPALLTLIKWLQNGKLNGIEGARAISKISKSVRIPSETYIETVFEKLVTDSKIQQQEYVSKITPITFSELVRKAQVDKRHSQNAYPIYNFGKLNPETDKAVTENYIPYMEKQLKKCIQNGDSQQAQAYILALGNFGHSKVLRVFEPYLEGQQKVSTFLRTLMVSSLRSLVTNCPEVAPVLYKIYLNEQESHEVRCAAVHLYMLTNPPLVSLLRMARYTNFDKSYEVNAAVRSSIISLSKWEHPAFYHISQKARQARRLLTSKKFSSVSSRGIFTEKTIMQIIGSDDGNVPKNVYVKTRDTFFVNLAKSVLEIEYGVSSVSRFIDIFEKPLTHQETAWLDHLRQTIGMQAKTVEQVEGNFMINSIVGTYFYPFDQQKVEKVASYIQKNLKKDYRMHINHMEAYDETISFPTESGLPFTHSIEIPTLLRISMSKTNGQGDELKQKTNGIFNVIIATKVQTRFGVVCSYDHTHYIAGLDRNSFLHAPVEYNVNVESQKPFRSFELKMHADPREQNSPLRLVHRDVVPLTGQINMSKLSQSSHNLHRVNGSEQKKIITQGTLQIVMEGDSEPELTPRNILQWALSFSDDSVNYKKVEVFNLVSGAHNDETIVTLAYDELNNKNDNGEHGNEIMDDVIDVSDKAPNSLIRRKQFLEHVHKGIKSATAYVHDVSFETPFLQNRQVLTVGVAKSDVEQKTQYVAYWNQQTKSGDVAYEALITGTLESTQDNFLSYDKAIHQVPKDRFLVNVFLGKNYKEGEKIQLKGRLTRSDSLSETLMKSKSVQECIKEMRSGKGLQACQKAINLALKKDLLQMSMKMNSDYQNEIANMIVGYIGETIPNANIEIAQNTDLTNKVNVEIKMLPNLENAEATLKTSQMNVNLPLRDSSENQLSQQDEKEDFENEEEEASCSVSNNEVVTFDQKSYPLYMGGIWHVLMIPDQQEGPNHSDINRLRSELVSVLTRQENNRLQVRVLVEDREYQLRQLNNNQFEVQINGQKVQVSEKYEDKENGQTIAVIYIQLDGSMTVNLVHNGVTVAYDGKTVRLDVTSNYRNTIRGLCGNYDKQSTNDFITPQNCILQRPEEFTATYALLNDKNSDTDTQRLITNNKEKASRANCTPLTPRQTNVINAREAGRLSDKQWWGYHQNINQNKKNQGNNQFIYRTKVDEDDQEVCFSIRPVLTCPEHTKPAATKKKNVAMHCMPNNDTAQEMKRRIQQGANPDLSHKTVSKKQVYEVPIACY